MRYSLLCLAGAVMATARPLAQSSPTYFFTFGDSYSQSNFDVNGTQPSASNPMGNPELGTGTTGGGINWVGYLTTVDNSSLVLNYNLAIGGATISNNLVSVAYEDMTSQVATFEKSYSEKPESAPWSSKDAIFGFWIGINDVGNAFWQNQSSALVPNLMDQYESLIKEIYNDGGRKFLFLNVPPTNRSPYFIDQGSDTTTQLAAWIQAYNDGLANMVETFKSEHSDVTTVIYDTHSFMNKVLDSPVKYGYLNATCINDNGESCVWWNNYHPGTKYHKLQAADMKSHLKSLGAW
ncbi:hypothetical protein N7532_003778 [Penicillium argentinense]|uniref:Cellulose-binding GDSL lipase/acylhydrolase n=1 Tax=Penicillium argentinense TaxID=1131581 RepID=A0A9W9FN79_9EURO|nr:uncharacterized protein N7532_003778 [Penicillium argentinense]KAJ5103249.1 hypothetical protein N7532_003778 [Penicillium argentinense]